MPVRMHNDGQHVNYIFNQTECSKHRASEGEPCWSIYQSDTGRYLPALCGSRIKKAGFNGTVSDMSMNRKASGPRKDTVIKRLEKSRPTLGINKA